MEHIFLSGATGFVGSLLAARLIGRPGTKVYALVRAGNEEEAARRLRAAWSFSEDLYEAVGERVIAVCGDFTRPGLGLMEEDRCRLEEETTLVIHAGAETGFMKGQEELHATNVLGTQHMLAFAAGMKKLRRFVHLSTAYVAGQREGKIFEEDSIGTSFSSLYEKSKAEAEALVRASSLPFAICRPGMIVGVSGTGWIRSFNTVYYVMKQMLLGKLRVLPIGRNTPLNILPVDLVADAVVKIAFSDEADGRTFHLTCPVSMAPRAGELADYLREWARKELGVELAKTRFIPLPGLRRAGLAYNQKEEGRKKGSLNNLLTLLPYFYGKQDFDRTNTDAVCGPCTFSWRDTIDPLLTFACRKNFMRQSGQTVFEQARVRRESTRYPICYYDVSSDGIHPVSGQEANRRIERILRALWAWGIRKGDKVALTGINSVDYMILEQAIGLIGAVSVPIYYTTPAREISLLLSRSGARWLFIGDKRIMEQAGSLQTEARLVSFSEGEAIRQEGVLSWEEFLSRDAGGVSLETPNPHDLATIRYTSGTTGEPKGVMFDFAQLSFMGEVLTNLLPWEDRNREMRYLSFLPLSHVVEGILASYAPYYCLCRVDYYFLHSFGSLTKALPEVRPNVFFSVPRFYEKLWDQVTANRVGSLWLSAKEGRLKRFLASVLKRAVLKRAGLQDCRQLIVGSAPMSEELLTSFRQMGIEIYNAYGQTEAPLITINRLGDNQIGTIGTPLPDTRVWAEEDGELIVEGPQVALGYYGLETETIRDGILHTGDLGRIAEDGHITLFGRKKDMIITSYGKNISIPKIEERLKDIPGVSEAVLIGENRPYCTALLWLEKEEGDLQKEVDRVNASLSHPEQIRFFRVIETPLSIQAGELTPNLKVKRAVVLEHFADWIEGMYR